MTVHNCDLHQLCGELFQSIRVTELLSVQSSSLSELSFLIASLRNFDKGSVCLYSGRGKNLDELNLNDYL